MKDLLTQCVGDLKPAHPEVTPEEIRTLYCVRCRNMECSRSGWHGDPMGVRAREQEKLLLHPERADPNASRYEPIQRVGFEDKRVEAEAWSPRARLKVLPEQTRWETGPESVQVKHQEPQGRVPIRDPWDPKQGRVAAPRAHIRFTESGEIEIV